MKLKLLTKCIFFIFYISYLSYNYGQNKVQYYQLDNDTNYYTKKAYQKIIKQKKKTLKGNNLFRYHITHDTIHDTLITYFNITPIHHFHIILDSLSLQFFKQKTTRLSLHQLEGFIEKELKHLENIGYPFAQITQELISEDPPTLQLHLNLGPLTYIDSIVNIGDAKILPGVLHKICEIEPKSIYNEKKISRLHLRINNYRFISLNSPVQMVFEDQNNQMIIKVNKTKGSNFNGIIGIQPNPISKKTVITGDLKLQLRNVFSHAESINLDWQRLADQTQELNINANIPFIFKSNFGLGGAFELYRKDSSFLLLKPELSANYYLGQNQWISVFYRLEQNNVLNDSQSQLSGAVNNNQTVANINYKINSFGVSWKKSRLDYPFNPRSGFELYLESSYGIRKAQRNTDSDSTRINDFQLNYRINGQFYIPIFKKQCIYFGLQSAFNSNENLYYNELYRIGGNQSLRGFDEESFYVSWFQVLSLEYRFLYEKNSNFFIFYDLAYWEQKYLNNFESDLPFGFGIGTRFGSKIGIFSISYALGKSFNNPIEFRNGKIHFGYSALF